MTTRREQAAIIFCATIGEYSLLIVPFIVTGMMQAYGVVENRAGDLVSLELIAMGIAGFIVSYAVRRISPRHIVAAGLFLVATANMGCALGAHEYSLFVFRVLAGIGEGAVMAATGALAANAANAHRLFSLLGLVIATVATLALIAAPALIVRSGPRTIFWLLAGVPILGFLVVNALPRQNIANADAPRLGAFAVPGALQSLLAFALLWVGASALWVFAERIGSYHGFTLGQIGLYLAIGQVAGILGPVISTRWGVQFGLQRSIFVGSMVMALAGLAMVYGHSGFSYTGGATFMSIGAMFLAPCFRSLMATLDASGSVNAMSVPFYTFGFGIAPIVVGGLSAPQSGYVLVAWLGAFAFVVSGSLALSIRRAVPRPL